MQRISWWIERLFGAQPIPTSKKRSRPRHASGKLPLRHRALRIEDLEERRMLSVTPTYADHTLTLTGDSSADTITVSQSSGLVQLNGSNVTVGGNTISASDVHALVIEGNSGNDTINLLSVNSTSFANLTSVSVFGGSGNDTIYGSNFGDILDGAGGTDTIYGEGGDDSLYGGDGNDTIAGQDGNDTIYGDGYAEHGRLYEEDNLRLFAEPPEPKWNSVTRSEPYNNNNTINPIQDPETVDAAVWWDLSGSTVTDYGGADTLSGGNGNDTIYGDFGSPEEGYRYQTHGTFLYYFDVWDGEQYIERDPNDMIIYNEVTFVGGNDQIDGGLGNDTLEGEGGNDTMYGDGNPAWVGEEVEDGLSLWIDIGEGEAQPNPQGAAGEPFYYYLETPQSQTGGDDVLHGGDGNDTLYGDAGKSTILSLDGYYNVEEWQNGPENSPNSFYIPFYVPINLTAGDDQLDGGAGSNVVTGEGGDDTYQFTDESGTAALHLGGDTVVTAGGTSGSSQLAEDSWNTPGGTLNKTGEGTLDFNAFTHLDDATTLNINEGVVNVNADAGSDANLSINVNEDTVLNINSTLHLDALYIGDGAVATVTDQTSDLVLVVNTIEIASDNASYSAPPLGGYTSSIRTYYGLLDLTDNDLIIQNESESDFWVVQDMIRSGLYTSGASGITSANAFSGPDAGLTWLGSMFNGYDDDSDGGTVTPDVPIYSDFGGEDLSTHSIMVKYTWFGDADLNGVVDSGDDGLYSAGYFGGDPVNQAKNPWLFGDFDYNGIVNGDDASLLTTAYFAQDRVL